MKEEIIKKIKIAFEKLKDSLIAMNESVSFIKEKKEITDILNVVLKWESKFNKQRHLSFISREEVLDIYYRLDELKETYLYDPSLGDEAELSDEAVIWMWELMLLRKQQFEIGEIK